MTEFAKRGREGGEDGAREYAEAQLGDAFETLSAHDNQSVTSGPILENAERRLQMVRLGVPRDRAHDPEVVAYVAAMKSIGDQEGFQVIVENQHDIFVEDHRIVLESNGQEVWLLGEQDHEMVVAAGERAGLSQVKERTMNPQRGAATARRLGVEIKQARGYYEGGNVLTTTLDGRKTVLVGENTVRINQELFAMQGSYNSRHATLALICVDLDIELSQLVVLPQASETAKSEWGWAYGAIDMLIRPGKDGEVFVNDPSETSRFLDKYRLREDEEYSEDFDAKLQGFGNSALAAQQKQVLQEHGFVVKPFPGEVLTFFDFANGIMARGTRGRYFISNESKWPALNRAFSDYMEGHGFTVHFVPTSQIVSQSKGGIDCMTTEVNR